MQYIHNHYISEEVTREIMLKSFLGICTWSMTGTANPFSSSSWVTNAHLYRSFKWFLNRVFKTLKFSWLSTKKSKWDSTLYLMFFEPLFLIFNCYKRIPHFHNFRTTTIRRKIIGSILTAFISKCSAWKV